MSKPVPSSDRKRLVVGWLGSTDCIAQLTRTYGMPGGRSCVMVQRHLKHRAVGMWRLIHGGVQVPSNRSCRRIELEIARLAAA